MSLYGCFLLYFQQIKHWVGEGLRPISNNLLRLSLPFFTIRIELHNTYDIRYFISGKNSDTSIVDLRMFQ
jgi:hypothetical protein